MSTTYLYQAILTMLIRFAILALACYSSVDCFSAPMGKIKSLSITDCDVSGPAVDANINFHNINENGDKALDFDLDLPYDADGSEYTFQLDVARWEGGSWKEGIYNVQGELCDYLKKYIPGVWNKLRENVVPPIEEECVVPKGQYKLRNFEAEKSDMNLPAILYGKFKLTFKIFNPNDEDIICKVYEAESTHILHAILDQYKFCCRLMKDLYPATMLVHLAILGLFLFSSGDCKSAPMGKIKSLSVTDCDVTGPALDLTNNFHNINENGDKAIDFDLDLPDDFDATDITFNLDVARWEDGAWKEGIYDVDGELCEYMKKYIPGVWTKLKEKIVPKIEEDCIVPKGKYKMTNFEAEKDDINVPSILYGKFKLTLKLFNPKDENIFCKVYEAESTQ
ncbi:uncharacterized protein LOC109608021 [Aethina tumida]|uniref:uncharacterized protein LOC109608021 n=1 Tax=Aethina tumida TaxID=116153 RepID=UPI002147AF6D|nr:uncharacterized protein LOC109608021 [Aethina tumida]